MNGTQKAILRFTAGAMMLGGCLAPSILMHKINEGLKDKAEKDLGCPRSELRVTRTGQTSDFFAPKSRYTVDGCGKTAVYLAKSSFALSADSYELVNKTEPSPTASR
jgi:hypothetical protein